MLVHFVSLALWLVIAPLASAQDPNAAARTKAPSRQATSTARAGTPSTKLDTTNANREPKVPAPRTSSVEGLVVHLNGSPVGGATVVVQSKGGAPAPATSSIRTDSSGRFKADSLVAGAYEIRVDFASGRSIVHTLDVRGTAVDTLVVPNEGRDGVRSRGQLLWTIACLTLFLLSLVFARWHHIARSVNAMLIRQLTALETRLQTEVVSDGGTADGKLQTLRARVAELLDRQLTWYDHRPSLEEFLFWSRGRENANWVAIHEIERQLIAFLAPPEQIAVDLLWTEAQLRTSHSPVASALADEIRNARTLPEPSAEHERASYHASRKALLGRGLSFVYNERDTGFSTLMEWQNKAGWLIMVAVLVIGFLVAAEGNAILFLAGAAGGYLSRLMRALKRDDVPLDYGASWTTLFLSPLLGAFAGWFGVAVIVMASNPSTNLLGSAFRIVQWNEPAAPVTLAIAFMLGFSERFFDAVVGAVEGLAEGSAPRKDAARGAAPATVVATANKDADKSAGANVDRPTIKSVRRQARVGDVKHESLLVTGTGFDRKVAVKVGDAEHQNEWKSPESLVLPLDDAEVVRLTKGEHLKIVVVNPNASASEAFDFAEQPGGGP